MLIIVKMPKTGVEYIIIHKQDKFHAHITFGQDTHSWSEKVHVVFIEG